MLKIYGVIQLHDAGFAVRIQECDQSNHQKRSGRFKYGERPFQ